MAPDSTQSTNTPATRYGLIRWRWGTRTSSSVELRDSLKRQIPVQSGQQRWRPKARPLVESEHDVHTLDCLTSGSLDQVINHRGHDDHRAVFLAVKSHTATVFAPNTAGFGMAAKRHHIHERLVCVTL